jgi:undecaprenol kinase
MKGQPFYRRLGFAINGLRLAFFREHSFRYHVISCVGVLIALILTQPSPIWWAIGLLAVGLVMVAELINTAIETLADHIHPERHQEIRAVKDIAAAAVLISSITAVLVAVVFLFYFFYA